MNGFTDEQITVLNELSMALAKHVIDVEKVTINKLIEADCKLVSAMRTETEMQNEKIQQIHDVVNNKANEAFEGLIAATKDSLYELLMEVFNEKIVPTINSSLAANSDFMLEKTKKMDDFMLAVLEDTKKKALEKTPARKDIDKANASIKRLEEVIDKQNNRIASLEFQLKRK